MGKCINVASLLVLAWPWCLRLLSSCISREQKGDFCSIKAGTEAMKAVYSWRMRKAVCLLSAKVTEGYFFAVSVFALQSPDPHQSNQNSSSAKMGSIWEEESLWTH